MGSTVYFPDQHTAEEWRELAKSRFQAEQDSWERSDTDGFLSQKAAVTYGHMYNDLAALAENGGREQMRWLFTADGEIVEDWRWIETRYGGSILIGSGDDAVFFNSSYAKKGAARLARDKAKGYVWGLVETDVVVIPSGWSHITRRKNDAPLKVIEAVSSEYEIDN